MDFLYFLKGLQSDFLDVVMAKLTHLGAELVFLAVAVFFLWCVNKRDGYFLLIVGFLGTQINQLLKVTFRIERPWVRDPNFQAVESAIDGAEGYSFPSGHTQCAVGTYGGIARITNRRWLKILSIGICLLIPFTRMYLGVHTPLDVGVSFAIAVVLVLVFYPLLRKLWDSDKGMRILLWAMIAWSLGQVLFMELFPFPADARGAELASGIKTAYKLLGAVLGFYCGFELDRRWIHFETKAVWWAQLLKLISGLIVVVGVQVLGKAVMGLLTDAQFSHAIVYFFMALTAGGLWPITFKWFSKLGK